MTRPRSLNSTQGSLRASSGQPASSLRASCRCSACWVCRHLRPLVGGCKYTGNTTGVEHHKILPRSLVRADPRHQYTPQNHGPRAWSRVATGVRVGLPGTAASAPVSPAAASMIIIAAFALVPWMLLQAHRAAPEVRCLPSSGGCFVPPKVTGFSSVRPDPDTVDYRLLAGWSRFPAASCALLGDAF